MTQQKVRMTPKDALQQAMSWHSLGRFDEAEAICRSVLKALPKDLNARHFLGLIKISRGQFKEAERILKSALKDNPNSAQGWSNLGAACLELGKVDQARQHLRKALKLDPDMAPALINWSRVEELLGNSEAALKAIERALKTNDNSALAHNARGTYLLSLDRAIEAIASFERALEIEAGYVEAAHNISEAAIRLEDFALALKWADRALLLSPKRVNTLHNKGVAHLFLEEEEVALDVLESVLEISPTFSPTLLALAKIYRELGLIDDAIQLYSKAIETTPRNAEIYTGRGSAFMAANRRADAKADYAKALEVEPGNATALSGYSELQASDDPDEIPIILESLMVHQAALNAEGEPSIELDAVLAHIHEKVGQRDEFLEYLQRANSAKKRNFEYDIKTEIDYYARLKSVHKRITDLSPSLERAPNAPVPIFVVSMPRSGTTLVEQILSAHSRVHGAGELKRIRALLNPLFRHNADLKTLLTVESLTGIRDNYLRLMRRLGGEADFVTDKTPHHFQHIGCILELIPDAKIVHLNRDPRAVCWSIYKSNFKGRGHRYSNDLGDLAHAYAQYLDLMEHWHKLYPGQIYDLDYERLTENQLEETKKLLGYCELDFEEACFDFHNNQRAVQTVSMQQVRRKMYTGSSDAWREYETFLEPLIIALKSYDVPLSD